jgi:hypothetical protein
MYWQVNMIPIFTLRKSFNPSTAGYIGSAMKQQRLICN